MKASIEQKLNQIQERYEELGALLSDADVIADQCQRSFGQDPISEMRRDKADRPAAK